MFSKCKDLKLEIFMSLNINPDAQNINWHGMFDECRDYNKTTEEE